MSGATPERQNPFADVRPEVLVNQGERSVAASLRQYLAHLRTSLRAPVDLAIATAYFNPAGYALLADELDYPRVRLLLGAEPEEAARTRSLQDEPLPERIVEARLRRALEGHVRRAEEDRDLLGFTEETDSHVRRLLRWLSSGRVEVRRLEDDFLHGKAFVVTAGEWGVIAGSSNFTGAGLARNLELNLGLYQPYVVQQVSSWFDDLWKRAKPFDLASIYGERFAPHPPWRIFARMLYERYASELEGPGGDSVATVPLLELTGFQRDGLLRAQRILDRFHGVIIADEVGLGKTFLVGELIKQAVQDRRQRVLVIAPAALRDGLWQRFLSRFQLGVEHVSFDDLRSDRLAYKPEEYAMIVVDEAHALRNLSTQRAEAFRRLIGGTPPKDLVFLSATPVNNSLWDLYNLISYFVPNDAAFADLGILSLRRRFSQVMALDPDDLSPKHLFDVLDAVAVRRTRPFIRAHYPRETIPLNGERVQISFPRPVIRQVDYDLSTAFPNFFPRFAMALEGTEAGPAAPSLTLARYSPTRYRRRGGADRYEVQLAGLLRSGLLKRFESSAHAFSRTCLKMAETHRAFLDLLDRGFVAAGSVLADWVATDTDDLDEIEGFLSDCTHDLEKAADFDVDRLRRDVSADEVLLRQWAEETALLRPEDDPKLIALARELEEIAREAREDGSSDKERRDCRKVLVFSYYADTVEWIARYLESRIARDPSLADYRGRLASVSGRDGDKEDVLFGFAPETTEAPAGKDEDRYDIIVATDVLSEGVNLQQARHIINYDLPWNPMRLVQRNGRIDRIGSPHAAIFLHCFLPDRELDALLGLEESLRLKLRQAANSIGVQEGILPGSEAKDIVYTETQEEMRRLREELDRIRCGESDLLERETGAGATLTGETYRKELEKALAGPDAAKIKALAWGSGSGFVVQGEDTGYVFCARVADHQTPMFRWVPVEPEGPGEPVADTLECLRRARPPEGPSTPRHLDEQERAMAYRAWKAARSSIFSDWQRATDPKNLTPPVPKVLQRAAQFIRDNPPDGYSQVRLENLVDALEAPHPPRILKEVRRIMAPEESPPHQALQLADLVDELGLRPYEPPKALQPITEDDIHLVCWLCIRGPEPG